MVQDREKHAVVKWEVEVDGCKRMRHEDREHVVICFHDNVEKVVGRKPGASPLFCMLLPAGVDRAEDQNDVGAQDLPPNEYTEHHVDVRVQQRVFGAKEEHDDAELLDHQEAAFHQEVRSACQGPQRHDESDNEDEVHDIVEDVEEVVVLIEVGQLAHFPGSQHLATLELQKQH